MADAIAPPTVTVLLSSSGSTGPVAVTVVSDSAVASQLLDGMQVEAQAQARATKGLLEVVTANGVLQLKAAPGSTLPAIPAGAKLTLQMVGQGDSGQLFLVGVNGRMLGGAAAMPNLVSLLSPGGSPQVDGMAGGRVPAPSPQSGQAAAGPGSTGGIGTAALGTLGLTATVIRPAMPAGTLGQAQPGQSLPGAPPGLPLDMPAGTRLTVRIAGVEMPTAEGAAPSPATAQQQFTTPSPAGGQPAITTGPMAPRLGMPPAAGQGLPPQMPQGNPATMLAGTVTAQPPGGQAVVQTPIATLSVPTQADMPVGTRLTLEVVGAPLPPLPPTTATRAEGLTTLGWPALTEALDTLANANQPQALEQLLRAIPQPDTRLAASMAVFTGAVRGGSARTLLPETAVRGLEKAGKKDIPARLKADLEALTEDAGRPVGNGDWRAYTIPMLHGGVVEPVRLFVRRPSGGGGDGRSGGSGDKANDHRFVLDFDLTRLGRLQLDGLVRREDKLFDLIIRTGEPISAEMRLDILGIFNGASELVGTKGTVSFQAGGRWMEFPPAPSAPTRIEV